MVRQLDTERHQITTHRRRLTDRDLLGAWVAVKGIYAAWKAAARNRS